MPIQRDMFTKEVSTVAAAQIDGLVQTVDSLKSQAVKRMTVVKSGMPLFFSFDEPGAGDKIDLLMPLKGSVVAVWTVATLPKGATGVRLAITVDGVGSIVTAVAEAVEAAVSLSCKAGSVVTIQVVSVEGGLVERAGKLLVSLAFVGDDRVQVVYDTLPEIFIAENQEAVQAVKPIEAVSNEGIIS